MKFLKESLVIALVLAALLLAGCTNQSNGGTPSGQNGRLVGSAVDPSGYSVPEAPSQAGDSLSDLGSLNDSSGLTTQDLQ